VLLVQHHTAAQVIGGLITLALAGAITIGVRRATVARLIVSRTGLKTRGMPARFGAALDWTEVADLTENPVLNDQLSRVVGELAAGLERQRERVRVIEQPTAGRAGRVDPDADDGLTPILLAVSDNGSQMISRNTHTFMTLLAIAQHFGRPSTPTDQAWIESLNGTIKGEWPHLLAIDDPAVLRLELDTLQAEYNSVRLSLGVEKVWCDVARRAFEACRASHLLGCGARRRTSCSGRHLPIVSA